MKVRRGEGIFDVVIRAGAFPSIFPCFSAPVETLC